MKRLIGLGMLLGLLVGCQGAPREVKVAVAFPLGLEVGQDMLHAAQMAVADNAGQMQDVRVTLLELDSSDAQGSPVSTEREKVAAQAALADVQVVAYVGAATSDQARAVIALLNQGEMATLSPSASWPGLTRLGFGPGEPGIYYPTGRRTFFRMIPSDDVQGAAAAQWADSLRFRRVALIHDQTAYGKGIAGLFDVEATDLGVTIVGREEFRGGVATPEELQAVAAQVLAARPELVYLGTSFGGGGSAMLRALREADVTLPVMVPDGMMQDELFTLLPPEIVEGVYATNSLPVDSLPPSSAGFVQAFEAAYGKTPPTYAVNTYETLQVVFKALARAESLDRRGVLDALDTVENYNGVRGLLNFSAEGDTSYSEFGGFQAVHGAWTFVGEID